MRFLHMRRCLICGLVLGFVVLACKPKTVDDDFPETAYVQQILAFRKARDDSFKNSPKSPLPENARRRFKGLEYYPINPGLRFKLYLNKIDHPDTISIMTTDGTDSPAIRYGYFEFTVNNETHRLYAYKMLDAPKNQPPHLFIPFLDATSGITSYGGGRYLDIAENDSNVYVIDFNKAYNPSCAYGMQTYRCPIPPAENTLSIPLLAGEKIWKN